MENFETKGIEGRETKQSETQMSKFWADIEKRAEDFRKPTAEDRIKDWWSRLDVADNKRSAIVDEGDGTEKVEKTEYPSTYEERMRQTPREGDRGHWTGERGETEYIPTDEEIKALLEKYKSSSIDYKDGIPDFSNCAEATVEIENMTDNREKPGGNYEQADQKLADKWNEEGKDGRTDWTARDIAYYRRQNGLTWHERNDMKTCDLIPTKINDYFGHLGGVAECKKMNAKEDQFDA